MFQATSSKFQTHLFRRAKLLPFVHMLQCDPAFLSFQTHQLVKASSVSVQGELKCTHVCFEQIRFLSSTRPDPIVSSESLGGWYDSHAKGKFMVTRVVKKGKSLFRDIPVNKSILAYIENVGVGIRPGRTRRAKNKMRGPNRRGGKLDDGILILKEEDEKEFLINRNNRIQRLEREEKTMKAAAGRSKSDAIKQSPRWLAPPPFASNIVSTGEDEVTEIGHKVFRLPVKVLGSAASIKDDLPRSSKGLSEVALAGRSNVGKSTLLNALLYGNQSSREGGAIQWQRSRGRTPEGAKLRKGVKAVVSNRPGETRAVTLYQLSSQILFPGKDGNREIKAKMSLVLADLPGYGFAYASDEKAEEWKGLMRKYILERGDSLKRVLLLVDARHGLKNADFHFLSTLQDALNYKS